MSLSEPDARPRTDVTWLRHRALPRTTPQQTPAPARPASLELSAPQTPAPARLAPAPPASTSLDLGAASPTAGTSLDLSGVAGGTSLDLRPAPPTPHPLPTPATGNLLDLSAPATNGSPALARPPVTPRKSAAAGDLVLGWEPPGAAPARASILTPRDPVVALTAVQSGMGTLTIAATLPASLAGLRLLTAYQLTDGTSGVLDEATGLRAAPPASPRPVVSANAVHSRGLVVDLLQVRDVTRLVVMLADPSAAPLEWSGALSVTTLSGARVSVPLERPAGPGVLAALSVHQVAGRLVLRAENDLVEGTLRDACTRYGITDLAWVDPWTPLT